MWRACKTLAKDPWRRFGFHADLCRFHADLCRFDVDLRRGRGGARPNTINYHANAHIMWVLKTRYVKTHVVNMCFCNRARAHPHPVKCLSPMAHNMMRTLVSTPQHFTTLHNTSQHFTTLQNSDWGRNPIGRAELVLGVGGGREVAEQLGLRRGAGTSRCNQSGVRLRHNWAANGLRQ